MPKNDIIWKSLGAILVNGVPREVLRPKTIGAYSPLGFGLGTSPGTPFTMITPQLFQIMSRYYFLWWYRVTGDTVVVGLWNPLLGYGQNSLIIFFVSLMQKTWLAFGDKKLLISNHWFYSIPKPSRIPRPPPLAILPAIHVFINQK